MTHVCGTKRHYKWPFSVGGTRKVVC